LLADYFALKLLRNAHVVRQRRYADSLRLYEPGAPQFAINQSTAEPANVGS
jgi:hypothetical protein